MNNQDILDNAPEAQNFAKYEGKTFHITKDGHTMLYEDIVKDLNRKSFLESELIEFKNRIAELEEERDQILNSALDSESNCCDLKERIAELEKESLKAHGWIAKAMMQGLDKVDCSDELLKIIAIRDLEQQRKGFWLGFEDARCHPDEMNILNQWENTKVFIEAKGGAE